jgi:hypothetical protein
MEATFSSEMSVDTQRTTRRYIPEDGTLYNHRCENLTSYILDFIHRPVFLSVSEISFISVHRWSSDLGLSFKTDVTQWDSSVGIATQLLARRPGFDSRLRQEIVLFSIHVKTFSGTLPSSYPLDTMREGEHSRPSSVEFQNYGAIPPLPHNPSWHSA